jgi:cytochrome b subunit of formate dehydrogenase
MNRWRWIERVAHWLYALLVVPLLLMVVFDRKRLRSGALQMDRWSADDLRWFWAALRGRSLRGGAMPPHGRFNAGQKASTIMLAEKARADSAAGEWGNGGSE